MYLGHISLLTKQLVQLKNDLRQFLYLYFPEVLPYCRNNLTGSILELLEQYPTSQEMAKSRQGKRNQVPYFTPAEWQDLRAKCKSGVGSSSDGMAEKIILDLARQIESLSQRIEEYYDMLYDLLPKEQLKILISMPGIAKRTAVILLSVIGDISRFDSSHNLVGYFGLYPVIKESGDGKKRPHMSKKGNALLRKHLYLSAMVACKYDPHLRSLYLKSVDSGMAKKSAICKIMNKMLRMLFGMLMHNQVYDPKVDTDYRGRCQQHKEIYSQQISLEEMEETNVMLAQAPISKRHAHNRKEQTNAVARTRSSNRSNTAPSNILSKPK
jgi:transposase